MDWYGEQAIERHRDRVRDIERYILVEQARSLTREDRALVDKALWVVGRWLVGIGKRLQARHTVCADSIGTYCVPSSILSR